MELHAVSRAAAFVSAGAVRSRARGAPRACTARGISRRPAPRRARVVAAAGGVEGTGERDGATLALSVLCAAAFAADKALAGGVVSSLALPHAGWAPWQLVSSLFCHASFAHLSGNLFFLLIFGRMVEARGGAAAVALVFLTTGVFANVASLLLLQGPALSLGASGAVFGLFVVSVAVRFEWSVRGLLETVVFGSFVVSRVLEEGAMSVRQAGLSKAMVQTNHIAHLGGALGGVLLLLMLRALAAAGEGKGGKSGGKSGGKA